jgi:hypothetical protein
VFQKSSLQSVEDFCVKMTKFLQRFMVGKQNEPFASKVLKTSIPQTAAAASRRNGK